MIAALIVGALTAWYLGMRAGIIAAGATFVALLAAAFIPGMTLAVYALVIAWTGAVYFLGPKMSKPGIQGSGLFGGALGQASAFGKKFFGRKS